MEKQVERLEQVTIRFAGDSGDGMQLTGGRFTSETALVGNDISTLPDFPSPASSSTSPITTSSRPATRPTCSWP
jgi:Pyruvate/2-oxoacid:ferredoxin oxidoreductase gamma subunit